MAGPFATSVWMHARVWPPRRCCIQLRCPVPTSPLQARVVRHLVHLPIELFAHDIQHKIVAVSSPVAARRRRSVYVLEQQAVELFGKIRLVQRHDQEAYIDNTWEKYGEHRGNAKAPPTPSNGTEYTDLLAPTAPPP